MEFSQRTLSGDCVKSFCISTSEGKILFPYNPDFEQLQFQVFHVSQFDSYYMSGQTDMVLLAHFRASVEAGNIMKSQHAPWLLCKSRDKRNTIQQPLTVQGADLADVVSEDAGQGKPGCGRGA